MCNDYKQHVAWKAYCEMMQLLEWGVPARQSEADLPQADENSRAPSRNLRIGHARGAQGRRLSRRASGQRSARKRCFLRVIRWHDLEIVLRILAGRLSSPRLILYASNLPNAKFDASPVVFSFNSFDFG